MASGQRVITYIDGFNLYYGMKSKGWQRFYWLNVAALSSRLLKPGQTLEAVKYFTAHVSSPAYDRDKSKRQCAYLDALATLPDVQMFFGHYLQKPVTCRQCGARWTLNEEKMTDVNIAVELLTDAYADAFDVAIIISADSDLAPPIEAVRRTFPQKVVVVVFPPARVSRRLAQATKLNFTLSRANLKKSQLPDTLATAKGVTLQRPSSWR